MNLSKKIPREIVSSPEKLMALHYMLLIRHKHSKKLYCREIERDKETNYCSNGTIAEAIGYLSEAEIISELEHLIIDNKLLNDILISNYIDYSTSHTKEEILSLMQKELEKEDY